MSKDTPPLFDPIRCAEFFRKEIAKAVHADVGGFEDIIDKKFTKALKERDNAEAVNRDAVVDEPDEPDEPDKVAVCDDIHPSLNIHHDFSKFAMEDFEEENDYFNQVLCSAIRKGIAHEHHEADKHGLPRKTKGFYAYFTHICDVEMRFLIEHGPAIPFSSDEIYELTRFDLNIFGEKMNEPHVPITMPKEPPEEYSPNYIYAMDPAYAGEHGAEMFKLFDAIDRDDDIIRIIGPAQYLALIKWTAKFFATSCGGRDVIEKNIEVFNHNHLFMHYYHNMLFFINTNERNLIARYYISFVGNRVCDDMNDFDAMVRALADCAV